MTTHIDKKIKGFSVVTAAETAAATATAATAATAAATAAAAPVSNIVHMSEALRRPDVLTGMTYKVKSPAAEHAFYVTINDVVLNEGTDHELRRPFEIFINSKNMEQFQWVVALTRIMSAVFRKGGDVTFLVEEMAAVFDPQGGYFKPGGVFMPSLVAEIGAVVKEHLTTIGLLKSELSPEQLRLIADKRAQFDQMSKGAAPAADADAEGSYPPNATMCAKCSQRAVIIMDGCATCLSCGNSKCG